ncbi:hypothetical protein [uncultured Maribacter sp.]|uniref:hypothetical protein n=1 Tax=uncultured Maribacter sp. TaxID=431308 RepID=UPI00260EB0EA|nr:hypothetical protein [uncultured Maribacter sp.]
MFYILFKKKFKSTFKQELRVIKKNTSSSLDRILAELSISFFKDSKKSKSLKKIEPKKKLEPLSDDLKQIAANQLAYSKLIASKVNTLKPKDKTRKIVFVVD